MAKNNGTKEWGSYAWTLLHIASLLCYQRKDVYLMGRVKSFIRNYWKLLPCAVCRTDADKYLKLHDVLQLSKPEQIFHFTFHFLHFLVHFLVHHFYSIFHRFHHLPHMIAFYSCLFFLFSYAICVFV